MKRVTDGVAVLSGRRTAFARSDGALHEQTAMSLAIEVSRHVVEQTGLRDAAPDRVNIIWGSSLPYPRELYGGREVAIGLDMPYVDGYATEYACATSIKTAADAALRIRAGEIDVAVAGGSESLSHQPLLQKPALDVLALRRLARDPADYVAAITSTSVADLLPERTPLSEPYSGHTMAYYAETLMADWGVTREDADAYAVASHLRAAEARDRLATRIVAAGESGTTSDDMVRGDSSPEVLAGLKAVHPELGGRVSVGNASRLTDGAAAVVVSSDDWAAAQGITPQGWIRSAAFTAHDPEVGVLLGPAFAIPRALERVGLTLADMDVVEIHEAFAGQVLSNLAALGSASFASEHLGREKPVGDLTPDDINRWGGSLSIGHPFGATGARLIMQTLDRLEAEGGQYGVIGLCVGGTRGAAMVVEVA